MDSRNGFVPMNTLPCHRSCRYNQMSQHTPQSPAQWPEGAVFTLGHSTLSIERFMAVLKSYRIERLVDIRTIPRSRHNPQFNDTALAHSLTAEQLKYVPMQALGGLRHARKDSSNTGWRNGNFRGYADYMQTRPFKDALEALIHMSDETRVAIMCAEALPWKCHRSLVADALNVHDVTAIEILSENNYQVHRLTPFAQVRGLQISYPPRQSTLL
jgi:uncharacterized protein (DUF488 family)